MRGFAGVDNGLIDWLIAIGIFILIFTVLYHEAFSLYVMFGYKSYKEAYVSDEIWYVSSARNILYKMLHYTNIETNDTRSNYYTLVFRAHVNVSSLKKIVNNLNRDKNCFRIVEDAYKGSSLATVTVFNNKTNTTFLFPIGNGLNAVYISVKNTESCSIESLIDSLNKNNITVIDTIPGWALPDIYGINNYFNLEHPPLGKYLILLSMILFHDYPMAWRLPSIICTSLLYVLGYFITRKILLELMNRKYAMVIAIITPIIMFFDNIYHTVGILAMLDPFLAMFTLLGAYIFIKYPYTKPSSMIARTILFTLAGLVKFSGLFIVPADVIEGFLVKGNIYRNLRYGFGAILRYYIVFPVLLLLFSTPLIQYFGTTTWYKESIEGAIKWHTTTKTIPNNLTLSPLDWFLGKNSFTLWIDKNTGTHIKAKGAPILYTVSAILGIVTIPISFRKPKTRRLILSTYSIITMYIILYLIGNKSLYSFYIIQFTPLLETQLVITITLIGLITGKKILGKKDSKRKNTCSNQKLLK